MSKTQERIRHLLSGVSRAVLADCGDLQYNQCDSGYPKSESIVVTGSRMSESSLSGVTIEHVSNDCFHYGSRKQERSSNSLDCLDYFFDSDHETLARDVVITQAELPERKRFTFFRYGYNSCLGDKRDALDETRSDQFRYGGNQSTSSLRARQKAERVPAWRSRVRG